MEQRAEQTAPNTNANMQQADPSALMSGLAALQEKTRHLESFIQENYAQLDSGGLRRQDAAAAMSSILYELIAAGAAVLHSVQVGDANSTALMPPAGPAPAKLQQDAAAISEVSKSAAVEAPSSQAQKASTTSSSKKPATKGNASAEAVTESGYEIVEMNEDDILVEHTHFCEICGKGFRRDANVRMHMRAHGNEYKTPEALMANKDREKDADKDGSAAASSQRRYSCPFDKCRRNREHRKFKPLKSIASLRNHYKRSHCPKMYTCNKCGKHFSVVGDLKTHGKTCGHNRWRCSCGTTFTRKDKLFGHVSLFEGHRPLLPLDELPSNATGSSRRRMPHTDSATRQSSEISDAKVSVNGHGVAGANFLLDSFDFQSCQMETKPADDGTVAVTADGDGDCRFYDPDFWTDFPAEFSDSCR